MNLKQLEVFVAVAESGSFSKAAETVCLTQSTASQHMAALEQHVGARLFDRTGRGAVLTEAGKLLLEHALQVMGALRGTEAAMARFRQAEDVLLRIACSSIPGTHLLPGVAARLRQSEPGLTLIAEISDTARALERLEQEAVELALVGVHPQSERIASEVIGGERVLLVARQDHRWGGHRSIEPGELRDEPLVTRESGSGSAMTAEALLGRAGVDTKRLKVSAVFSTSEAVKQAVLAGCGPAFLSEAAVAGELERGELVAVSIRGVEIRRSFHLAYRRGRTLSPAAERLRRALREHVPPRPAA